MEAQEHVLEVDWVYGHIVDVPVVDARLGQSIDETLRLDELGASIVRNEEALRTSAHAIARIEVIRVFRVNLDVERHIEVVGCPLKSGRDFCDARTT